MYLRIFLSQLFFEDVIRFAAVIFTPKMAGVSKLSLAFVY